MSVRAAIVGLGRWGQMLVNANAGQQDSPLRFTAGVTRTPAKAEAFAAQHGFPVSDDYDAALGDPQIDAVVLATPHSQHSAQIVAAAEAGKHVFVEKPFALTLAEAQQAVDACARHGVVLAVGFNRRFLPAYQALCAMHEAGDLGTPLHVDANFSGPFGYDYTAEMWRGSAAENPAGGMAAMGIHMLDAMIRLMGPVASVSTLSRRRAVSAPLDDTTTVQLEFANGATGSLTTLMATAPNWRFQLFGAKGWAAMPDQHHLDIQITGQERVCRAFDETTGLAEELAHFARCVQSEATFPVTNAQALAGVAAMQAIARSAEQGGENVAVSKG